MKICVIHHDPLLQLGIVHALAPHGDVTMHDNAEQCDIVADTIYIGDYDSGMALARRFPDHVAHLRKKIIILTYSGRECDARLALEHGVSAYLLQGCTADELVATVRSVQAGLTRIDPSMAKKVAESMFRPKLSTRETQVLGLVAEGLLNKSIGVGLGIAEDTVKAHLKTILVKLNAVSRTQAVVLAARRGIIHLD
ncbi:MAG: DNA-binding response regulator [Sphingomonadaceae bacterium]